MLVHQGDRADATAEPGPCRDSIRVRQRSARLPPIEYRILISTLGRVFKCDTAHIHPR